MTFVTFLSPRVTPFQGRNSLGAGSASGFDWPPATDPIGVMLDALGRIVAARDPATSEHALRVQRLSVSVAQDAGLGDDLLIAALHAAAPLHDIGKLAIPDQVLHKPGPLSPDEYELVKRHAAFGADILERVALGRPLTRIVRHHHENWDGSGYPDRLCGDAIPLGARVLSVVDCYDALTSERPYREALAHCEALEIIVARRGTMYDPAILDVFVRVVQRLRAHDAALTRDLPGASPYRRPPARRR